MVLEELTTEEATRLIQMLKEALLKDFTLPTKSQQKELLVLGDKETDKFVISIYRGAINDKKINFGARIEQNGQVLLQLHLNPSNVHINPDGEKITGNHWHIYKEGFGKQFAYPATDIIDDDFVKNTIVFLQKFNVVKKPNIILQANLI